MGSSKARARASSNFGFAECELDRRPLTTGLGSLPSRHDTSRLTRARFLASTRAATREGFVPLRLFSPSKRTRAHPAIDGELRAHGASRRICRGLCGEHNRVSGQTSQTPGPRIYNLFPLLAGPIETWSPHFDRIASMGFDWVYLNPFHYPGFSGSLYAVKDYDRLHPRLHGESAASVEDLLREMIGCARSRGLSVMMDLVVNHTSKDALLAQAHPEWYLRGPDGEVQSPSAIDPADATKVTVWGDLAELDYAPRPERAGLVSYFADLVGRYARLGFGGFRCDAAYKVPADVWSELIAAARSVDPNALFAAETLGCRLEEVSALAPAGFDYLFNSARWWDFQGDWLLEQYAQFRHLAPSIAFPESHDTDRLVNELKGQGLVSPSDVKAAYKRLYLFVATFSSAVMMPVGYEFGFGHPVNVVRSRPEDWETPRFDLTKFIGEVNRMRAKLPALNVEGPQTRLNSPTGALGLVRRPHEGSTWVLTVINPDRTEGRDLPGSGHDPLAAAAARGTEVTPGAARASTDPKGGLLLWPGEIRVFSGDGELS